MKMIKSKLEVARKYQFYRIKQHQKKKFKFLKRVDKKRLKIFFKTISKSTNKIPQITKVPRILRFQKKYKKS